MTPPSCAICGGDLDGPCQAPSARHWVARTSLPELLRVAMTDPVLRSEKAEAKNPPAYRVERLGRILWGTQITHGMMAYGPDGWMWLRWSKRSAQRKGERELRRYLRRERWNAEACTVGKGSSS